MMDVKEIIINIIISIGIGVALGNLAVFSADYRRKSILIGELNRQLFSLHREYGKRQQNLEENLGELGKLSENAIVAYLSAEVKALGYGGISLISRLSGISRQTLTEGVKELDSADSIMPEGRSRKSGGGRKPAWEKQPGILPALEETVSAHTKGDPMKTIVWTNKSLRTLSKELTEKSIEPGMVWLAKCSTYWATVCKGAKKR
jgi:hypothetical protein